VVFPPTNSCKLEEEKAKLAQFSDLSDIFDLLFFYFLPFLPALLHSKMKSWCIYLCSTEGRESLSSCSVFWPLNGYQLSAWLLLGLKALRAKAIAYCNLCSVLSVRVSVVSVPDRAFHLFYGNSLRSGYNFQLALVQETSPMQLLPQPALSFPLGFQVTESCPGHLPEPCSPLDLFEEFLSLVDGGQRAR
jgi:hypothetical protein